MPYDIFRAYSVDRWKHNKHNSKVRKQNSNSQQRGL